jgi:preprotein translocase subunit SecB
MTDETTTTQPTAGEPKFAVEKIYIKDASLESPNSPAIFKSTWVPEINLQFSNAAKRIDDNAYEVVLTITVTAKIGEKNAYLVELQQAGIFSLRGFQEADLGALLASYCPSVLYPYACETIYGMINKGGFPSLYLAPINFDAIWAKQQKDKEKALAAEALAASH